jgi:hypothetical protein
MLDGECPPPGPDGLVPDDPGSTDGSLRVVRAKNRKGFAEDVRHYVGSTFVDGYRAEWMIALDAGASVELEQPFRAAMRALGAHLIVDGA